MTDLSINVKEVKRKSEVRYSDGVAGNDANTVLLMHFDEETASWVDSSIGGANSPHALTIDAGGSTVHLAPSPDSKFNRGSILAEDIGSGASEDIKLALNNIDDFKNLWNSSAWTIDFWIKIDIGTTYSFHILKSFDAGDQNGIGVYCANGVAFYTTIGGVVTSIMDNLITHGEWTHIAFEKYNGNYYYYINGVIVTDETQVADVLATSDNYMWLLNTDLGSGDLGVRVDELRISKVARYYGVDFIPASGEYIVGGIPSLPWNSICNFNTSQIDANPFVPNTGANWTLVTHGGNYTSGVADSKCLDGKRIEFTTNGTDLYLKHDASGTNWYDNVNNANGWTVECRVRIMSEILKTTADASPIIYDGVWALGVRFFNSDADGAGIILADNYISGGDVFYNGIPRSDGVWADYHIIRITGKGTEVKIYLDGVLVLTATLDLASSLKFMAFGDPQETGFYAVSHWDYFKYTTVKDFTPSEGM